jgi:hypothetical protein
MKLNRRDVAQTPLLKSKHAQLRRSHRQGNTVTHLARESLWEGWLNEDELTEGRALE